MSVDPFSPMERAANNGQLPPAPQPFVPYPPNPQMAQPFPAYPPAPAPLSDIPSAPAAYGVNKVYADIGEIPDLNSVELRDYSEADSRLKVLDPHPDLEYRWCNSDLDRQQLLYRRGWRPVRRMNAAASDETSGDTPQLMAGTQRDGQGRRAILMARPKHFSELQRENHRRMLRMQQASLDPKSFSGNEGRDAGTFKGQITIDGS